MTDLRGKAEFDRAANGFIAIAALTPAEERMVLRLNAAQLAQEVNEEKEKAAYAIKLRKEQRKSLQKLARFNVAAPLVNRCRVKAIRFKANPDTVWAV